MIPLSLFINNAFVRNYLHLYLNFDLLQTLIKWLLFKPLPHPRKNVTNISQVQSSRDFKCTSVSYNIQIRILLVLTQILSNDWFHHVNISVDRNLYTYCVMNVILSKKHKLYVHVCKNICCNLFKFQSCISSYITSYILHIFVPRVFALGKTCKCVQQLHWIKSSTIYPPLTCQVTSQHLERPSTRRPTPLYAAMLMWYGG